jgi:hypothetical protein
VWHVGDLQGFLATINGNIHYFVRLVQF